MKFPKILILFSVILGIALGIISLPYNPTFNMQCERLLKKLFEQVFDCKVVRGTLSQCDLTGIRLHGKNIKVVPHDTTDWYWTADTLEIYSSWFDLIRTGTLQLELYFSDLYATSSYHDHQLAIADHIKHMIGSTDGLPIQLKKIQIQKAYAQFQDHTNVLRGNFTIDLQQMQHTIKSTIYLNDVELLLNNERYVYIPETKTRLGWHNKQLAAKIQSKFLLKNSSDQNNYFLNAHWHDNQGSIEIHSKNNVAHITTALLGNGSAGINAVIEGQLPLSILQEAGFETHDLIRGSCTINAALNYHDELVGSGTIASNDSSLYGISVGDWQLSFNKHHKQWQTQAQLNFPFGSMHADLAYDQENNRGTISAYNATAIEWPNLYWKIYPKNCTIACAFDAKAIHADYQINTSHHKLNELIPLAGQLNFNAKSLILQGSCNEYTYAINCSANPFALNNAQLLNKSKIPVISIQNDQNQHWMSLVSIPYLRHLIEFGSGYIINAEGMLRCDISHADDLVKLSMNLEKSVISLSPLYNFMHDFNAVILFDFLNKKITVEQLKMQLHKGTIVSKHGTLGVDSASGNWFMHMPIIVDRLFLNKDKDLFALLSGGLLCKNDTESGIQVFGNLWLDEGQLNRNIFSVPSLQTVLTEFHHIIQPSPTAHCNIVLNSKKPFHIKTSFLSGEADFSVAVLGSFTNPTVNGWLSIQQGLLAFPYKPLYLTNAKLFFDTPSLLDPTFEFTAKNNINKYAITLRGSGSLKNPSIYFESTPPLQEEQIITLLLAGSEKDSIALAMPSIVMQNIQNIIFGPEQSELKLTNYFQRLLHPLKNIRIVPSFVDQTGRGGFRGALEIDLDDQLRALIQKNFSQPEDTKFEVEYAFSNDLILRGIKDEHGDLGGEVEMRWKF